MQAGDRVTVYRKNPALMRHSTHRNVLGQGVVKRVDSSALVAIWMLYRSPGCHNEELVVLNVHPGRVRPRDGSAAIDARLQKERLVGA